MNILLLESFQRIHYGMLDMLIHITIVDDVEYGENIKAFINWNHYLFGNSWSSLY